MPMDYNLQFKKSGLSRKVCDTQLTTGEVDEKAFERVVNISQHIVDFVKGCNNLLIYSSNTGNGKTTTAQKLGDRYIKSTLGTYIEDDNYTDGGYLSGHRFNPVYFVNLSQLFILKKMSFSDLDSKYKIAEVEDRILKSDLVIWDEIAITTSDFERQYFQSLLESRLMKDRYSSNIFTYGHEIPPQNCEDLLGDRLKSRLLSSVLIEYKGLDKRY